MIISQQAADYLHTLLLAQRDLDSFLKAVTVTSQLYIALEYTEKKELTRTFAASQKRQVYSQLKPHST